MKGYGFIFCNYPRPRFSPALPYNLAHKEAKKSVISSEAQSTESRYDKLFSLKSGMKMVGQSRGRQSEGDENSSAEFRLSNLAGDFRLDD